MPKQLWISSLDKLPLLRKQNVYTIKMASSSICWHLTLILLRVDYWVVTALACETIFLLTKNKVMKKVTEQRGDNIHQKDIVIQIFKMINKVIL